jgi:Prenyltransferase and squalene oxidase repeat
MTPRSSALPPALCGFFVWFLLGSSQTARAEDPSAQITAAIRSGSDFLLSHQNPDGSWGSARKTKALNIYAPLPGAHQAYKAGATELALCGLIDARDSRSDVESAISRAAIWTAKELPQLRRADLTTTYNVWGHAYALRAMSRLYLREPDPAKKSEWARLAQEQINLVNRYEDVNAGWGYLDLFDEIATQKPSGIPTSFTTATVLLAMDQARRTMASALDEKIVTRSIAALNYQRTPDFSYTYSFEHRMRPRLDINRPAGSLARSQSCNAALRIFGEKAITDEVLTTWADRFLAREGFLSDARKRPVPHEGAFRIAGYFYYYGIYYFTECVKLLPPERHAHYASALASVILSHQEKDGSWWDYPLYDYHQAYGTGYALMALAWCRDALTTR